MRIRIRIQQLKVMRIHVDPDPEPCYKTFFLAFLGKYVGTGTLCMVTYEEFDRQQCIVSKKKS